MNKKSIVTSFAQFKRVPIDEEFVDEFRAHLVRAMGADATLAAAHTLAAARNARFFTVRRLIPAFIVFSLVLTSGGTAFAAQHSLPGETLYPVKLLTEEVRVAVALTPAKKAELQMAYAEERTKEISAVLTEHATSTDFTASETKDIDHALLNLTGNLENAERHAAETREKGDEKKAKELHRNLSEAAHAYREALEKNASSTEDESVRGALRAAADSAEHVRENAKREGERDEEALKHAQEKENERVKEMGSEEKKDAGDTNAASLERATHKDEDAQRDER